MLNISRNKTSIFNVSLIENIYRKFLNNLLEKVKYYLKSYLF